MSDPRPDKKSASKPNLTVRLGAQNRTVLARCHFRLITETENPKLTESDVARLALFEGLRVIGARLGIDDEPENEVPELAPRAKGPKKARA